MEKSAKKQRTSLSETSTNVCKSCKGVRQKISSLENLKCEEVESSYSPILLDPGWKSVCTAKSGYDTRDHTTRRCSIKEYYHYTDPA